MSRPLLAWLPAVLWAAGIYWLSSRPTLPAPSLPGFDKAAHFAAYAVLGWLLAFAAERARLPLAVAAGLGLLYGATDELHQAYVPGRSAELADWLADAAGVAAAVFLYSRWRARRTAARRAPAPGEPPPLRA